MLVIALVLGFLFGFIGSMPIAGPIAVLVLAFGLEDRFRAGVSLAMGGAIAEASIAFLSFWGMSAILSLHPLVQPVMRIAGAVILIALGLLFALKTPGSSDGNDGSSKKTVGTRRSFFLGFTITALNPTLFATWTGAVAVLSSTQLIPITPTTAVPFALGAGVGIVSWFTTLLLLIARFKSRIKPSSMSRIIRATGVALAGLGIWMGIRSIIG